MAKAEISWKGRTEDGTKREVYAQHVGNRWLFYCREQRFDQWEPLPQPLWRIGWSCWIRCDDVLLAGYKSQRKSFDYDNPFLKDFPGQT